MGLFLLALRDLDSGVEMEKKNSKIKKLVTCTPLIYGHPHLILS